MDWSLFWTAFGAIGTTAGSLITAAAVVVAVRQYKQPLIKRLNIKFTNGFAVMSNGSLGETLYCITLSNSGIRPIVITNIYLNIGQKNLMINNVEYTGFGKTVFPCTLNQEESMEMRFEWNVMASEFSHLIQEKGLLPATKVSILAHDTTGGEHLYPTGLTAQQFANNHD